MHIHVTQKNLEVDRLLWRLTRLRPEKSIDRALGASLLQIPLFQFFGVLLKSIALCEMIDFCSPLCKLDLFIMIAITIQVRAIAIRAFN
jgi:hypothetical protein